MDDFRAALAGIRRVVPAESSVVGSQTYWFGLPDRRYWPWEQLVYYRRYAPGSRLENAFRAFHPDFLIIDAHMEQFIADDKARLPSYFQALSLPKADLERFLDEHGRLAATIETEAFGSVLVYQLDRD